MAGGAVARRYAKALFELAREAGSVTDVRSELRSFAELLRGNEALRGVVLRPLHPAAERRAVLRALAERLGASPLLRSFQGYLVDQRRLVDYDAIVEEYERLADEEVGITKARVRSATALRDHQLERLRQAIGARTGRQVEIEVQVEPDLLGGVVVQVGDMVFDGTLRSQLAQLGASLARG